MTRLRDRTARRMLGLTLQPGEVIRPDDRPAPRRDVVPVTDGLVECPVCHGGVRLRSNGHIGSHVYGGKKRKAGDGACLGTGPIR